VVALVLVLAGCSAASDDASSTGGEAAAQQDAGDGFAASGDVQASGDDGAAVGTPVSADAAGRQVITTGEVALVAEDPRAAADAVVQAVEAAGGRVDGRQQSTTAAGTAEGDAPVGEGAVGEGSWARLTVRVPADEVTPTVDALDAIGTVSTLDIRSEDVTGTAQDLDARIRATEISVTRLEDLLSRATTSADVIAAEQTLSERQSTLEQLESERARLSEQVALSTLTISITTDPVVVAETEEKDGFLDGLAAGWTGLLTVLRVALVVVGAVLPWAVLAGLVLAVVLWVRRWLRGRRPAVPTAEPVAVVAAPGPDLPRAPQVPGDDRR
jgi:hypothetical protein